MSFGNPHATNMKALPPHGSKARRLALILMIAAPLLYGLLNLFLGQDTNWDFRNYHWYNGYAIVTGRLGIDLLPSQTPFFYNPALDIPYFLLATYVPAKVAGFILASVQGLNFILIFMLCHYTLQIANQKQKVWVCAGLAALGLLGGGGIAQIGTTFYDNVTSLGLFASTLLVIRHFKTMLQSSWGLSLGLALLCGLPAGLMMGFKLPFVVFCIGLCGALLFVTGPLPRRLWMAFGFGLGVLIGTAITQGWWAYYQYTTYGSPLFPYFNDIFRSPFAPMDSGRDMKFLPTTWSDKLLFPFVFASCPWRTGEIPWRDLRIPFLYALLPICVLARLAFGRTKNAPDRLTPFYASRYLLWSAVISYIVWLKLFAIYRYIIPLEMIAPLLIVIAMGMMPLRPQARALITGFILLTIAATIQPGDWGRKKPWLDRAVEVTVPPMGDTSNLMLLIAGFEPFSHVLTEFPPEVPVVRIQSNFASPEQGKGINRLLEAKVDAHKGRFKLLVAEHELFHAGPALNHFGLTFSPQSCQAVEDHLFPELKLKLCDVQQTKKSVKP